MCHLIGKKDLKNLCVFSEGGRKQLFVRFLSNRMVLLDICGGIQDHESHLNVIYAPSVTAWLDNFVLLSENLDGFSVTEVLPGFDIGLHFEAAKVVH